MSKVFLIGRRRTGIATMQKALTTIGFKKSSLLIKPKSDKIKDLIKEMKDYDFCAVSRDYTLDEIRAIEAAYPDSRFVLTKRDSVVWYASFVRYYNSLKGEHPQTVHTNKGHYVSKFYDGYNEDVRVHFDGRTWKLLTINLNGSQSWSQVCTFFKKPIPNKPFPHENIS